MRIISGKYKGKILKSPSTLNIRPTADKVKQAFFTKYQFEIDGCNFLDLFCGSGAIGIEAISRNCNIVYFIDKEESSLKLLNQNLSSIQEKNYKIIKSDSIKFLHNFDIKNYFDFIFIDPPYKSNLYNECLNTIYNKQILKENGIICCETDLDYKFKNTNFILFDEKKYGNTKLYFFKNK